MKLTNLHISGFGRFGQEAIGPFGPNITVVYGPNEAGKSTLLEFIRTVLFGFPRQARDKHYPPLLGGRHGGRVEFCDDDGETWTLERFAGVKGGPFTLRRGSGAANSDEGILQRLTAHATKDLFRNVYAFTLDELQSQGLLKDDAVAGRIYSAGMGVTRLPDFSADLRKRKEDLFKPPRGRKQKLSSLLKELEQIDSRLKELGKQSAQYQNLIANRETIDIQLSEGEHSRRDTEGQRRHAQQLLDAWEDWESLQDCGAQLAELPDFPDLPESAVERLDSLEDQIQQTREARDELQERLREETANAERPIPHAMLLSEAQRVERIRRARGGFDESVGDLPDRQSELQALQAELERHLGDLGRDWDTERIARIDTSPARQQEIETLRTRWSNAADRVRDAEAVHQRELQEFTRTREELDRITAELQLPVQDRSSGTAAAQGAGFDDLLGLRDSVEAIRRGRTSFDASVGDLPERRAELKAIEQEFAERLRDLGQNWDEEALLHFDSSLVFRQEIAKWQTRLQDCDRKIHEASAALEQSQRLEADAQRNAAVAAENLPPAPVAADQADPDLRRRNLRLVRSRLDAFLRARDAADSLRNQLDQGTQDESRRRTASRRSWRWVSLGSAVLGIGILVSNALWMQSSIAALSQAVNILALAALLGVAIGLWRGLRRVAASGWMARLTDAVEAAEQTRNSARTELESTLLPLQLQELPTAEALDALEDEIDRQATVWRVWRDGQVRVDELQRTLRQRQERTVECRKELDTAQQTRHLTGTAWSAWLQERGVSGDWAPATINELTARVDEVRARLGQVQQFRARVQAIQVDIDEYIELVRPLAIRFGVPVEEANLDRFKAAADFLIDGLEQARTLDDRRTASQRRTSEQQAVVDAAGEALAKAEATRSEADSAWDKWRRGHQLPDDLTPFGAGAFLAKIETARGAADQAQGMHARIGAIQTDIDEFGTAVASLAGDCGMPLASEHPEVVADTADMLIGHAAEAQRLHAARQEATTRRDTAARDLQRQDRRLADLGDHKTTLLDRGKTDDPEMFRHRVATQGRRRELERHCADCNRSLRRNCGTNLDFDDFLAELASGDVRSLREQERGLTDHLASIAEEQARLLEVRGGIETELSQLATETESAQLRLKKGLLLERLRDAADEWSKLALAELLLTETRRKFEEDRQPAVIRHAEQCFREVTENRYDRVYAPVGEQTVEVRETATGDTKGPEQLSRGTREQLYLALRFGLIREFGEHAERLPVVVDEVLVNFDPDRARRAAAAFATLSQTNQVIVFTCHATMRDLFASEGATVLDISRESA